MRNKKFCRTASILIAVAMVFSVIVFMPEDASAAARKPGKVKITKGTKLNQMITLTWKKTKGAKKYQIYAKKGKGKWKKVATVKANGKSKQTYSIKRCKWNTKYQVKMRAVKGKKKGKWSTIYKGKLAKKTTLQKEINRNASARKDIGNAVEENEYFKITMSVSGNTIILNYLFKIPVTKADTDEVFNSGEMRKEMKSVITKTENNVGIFGIGVLVKALDPSGKQVASYTYK